MKEQAMKAEVKAVLDTLTAERNRIDRAIAALKAMDGGDIQNPAPLKKRQNSDHSREPQFGPEVKAVIATAMMDAYEHGRQMLPVARAMATTYGGAPSTISGQWRKWSRFITTANNSNGNGSDVQPETNATAIGIQ